MLQVSRGEADGHRRRARARRPDRRSARTACSPSAVPMTLSSRRPCRSTTAQAAESWCLRGEVDGLQRPRDAAVPARELYASTRGCALENGTGAPRTVTVTLPWVTRQDAGTERRRSFPASTRRRSSGRRQGPSIGRCDLTWRSRQPSSVGRRVDRARAASGTSRRSCRRAPGFKLVAAMRRPRRPRGDGARRPRAAPPIAVRATPTIAPGQAWEGEVAIFAGPKEYDRLKALGLEGTINFGGFPVPRDVGRAADGVARRARSSW